MDPLIKSQSVLTRYQLLSRKLDPSGAKIKQLDMSEVQTEFRSLRRLDVNLHLDRYERVSFPEIACKS